MASYGYDGLGPVCSASEEDMQEMLADAAFLASCPGGGVKKPHEKLILGLPDVARESEAASEERSQ